MINPQRSLYYDLWGLKGGFLVVNLSFAVEANSDTQLYKKSIRGKVLQQNAGSAIDFDTGFRWRMR
jgi:hypothetical protein